MKHVALIGSSGGGTATLGHTDPRTLLRVIHQQLQLCGGRIASASFVALDGGKGMDGVVNEEIETATSYAVKYEGDAAFQCSVRKRGTLKAVNNDIRENEDERLARDIASGKIHGLICISCHPGLFREALTAAAVTEIPVTGSGGTSLSKAVSLYGLKLTGNAGGSVATTSYSRAVSYTYSLASYWKRDYRPWKDRPHDADSIQWTSVLNACLPVFWGVCLAKFLLQTCFEALDIDLESSASFSSVHHADGSSQQADFAHQIVFSLRLVYVGLENWALPVACAVIMATSSSNSGKGGDDDRDHMPLSSLLMASVLASMVCYQSILSGLLAGWLVRRFAVFILFKCVVNNVPATMTNLVTTGGTGCFAAFALLPVAPILRRCTVFARSSILWTVTGSPFALSVDEKVVLPGRVILGFLWGCACCYASKVGWYHAFFLPAILIEMEKGEPSFLGAIDELTLVMVCAGVCAGNLTALKIKMDKGVSDTDASLCRRGLSVNLLYGDFVEVCYPFMEQSTVINIGGYLASGLSSAWLVASADSSVPKSLAYLPLPLSIALARNEWHRMMVACFIAFACPFAAALLNVVVSTPKRKTG